MGTKGKKKTTKKRVDKNLFIRSIREYNKPLTPKERQKFMDMIHHMATDDIVELIHSHYGNKQERALLVAELLIRNLE